MVKRLAEVVSPQAGSNPVLTTKKVLMKPSEVQEGGNHYKNFTIQPTEFIYKNGIPFIEGNVIKYVIRHRSKNGLQDLKKAKHYIDLLIELEYPEKNERQ